MLVYGRNVAKEILKKDEKIKKIIIQKDFSDKEILSLIEKRKLKPEIMDKNDFSRFAKFSHQGIILDIGDFAYSEVEEMISDPDSFVVILDHLEDPHNLGAIIRTCEAAGVNGIIIPKDRSVSVNATVMKTSAGALNNMKICKVTNLNRAIDELKENGIWIIGTDMDNSISYTEVDYNIPIALVIGSEGFGISRLVREKCDYVVNIPMNGSVNSLNASVAAGILIYKVLEKRN